MTDITLQETGNDAARIVGADGQVLAEYRYGEDKNHPFFSAIRPLNHPGVISNTAPWDHRWHHGLWWSWKFINDVLYWEDHEGYGGNRIGLGRSHATSHGTDVVGAGGADVGNPGVLVSEILEWRPDGESAPVLTEERTMHIHTDVAPTSAWAIDWNFSWTATRSSLFTATPYPENWWGGYGGLNFRAARSLAAGERIEASGGRTCKAAVHGEAASWLAYSGNVDGAGTDDPDHPAFGGLVILSHDANPNPRPPAYAFSAADEFGFIAAAPLMHDDLALSTGESLDMRFRTVIFGEQLTSDDFDSLHQQYNATT